MMLVTCTHQGLVPFGNTRSWEIRDGGKISIDFMDGLRNLLAPKWETLNFLYNVISGD